MSNEDEVSDLEAVNDQAIDDLLAEHEASSAEVPAVETEEAAPHPF